MDTPKRIIRLARQERRAGTLDQANSMPQHERRARFAMAIHRRWLQIMGNGSITPYSEFGPCLHSANREP